MKINVKNYRMIESLFKKILYQINLRPPLIFCKLVNHLFNTNDLCKEFHTVIAIKI